MQPAPLSNPPLTGAAPDPRFRCGTLVYTKAGLFTLFAYLLWGDFCFSLMEAIWPKILPLMLKAEGTPNVLISLVITTIPSAMNFIMNPIVGTASDRYRGRRGRRIPFLLFATPFIAFFLILLGFSRELGSGLHGLLENTFPSLSAASVTISLICGSIICFRFFELIVNTIFWYLFNDVVPSAFIGRFLGFFRVIGSLAGALFNFLLFRYAESHTSVIFFGVAILYGVGFLMMCLKVKEGEYPPPELIAKDARPSPLAYATTFLKECFSHRIFRLIFAYNASVGFAGSIGAFMIFMEFSIGLTIDQIGKIAGAALFLGMLLMYPMGSLVDRFHPLRVMIAGKITYCLVMSFKLIFLFQDFSKTTAFWIYATAAVIAIPVDVANKAAALPMLMRLFPHERFGQFCAANAMCGALGMILGGVLAGLFLDLMKTFFPGNDFYYRFVPLWAIAFISVSLFFIIRVFHEWRKLGGDSAYRPPIEDKFEGFHHQG